MRWRRQKQTTGWPELSPETMRQRAKILVVDDQPFSYEPLFRRDGYSLDVWLDVESLDRMTDDTYDLIILDMSGVGRDIAKADQGFGVLRHVKDHSPWKPVIAYSGKKWSLDRHNELSQANLVLDKGLDYVDLRRQVDELLRFRFSKDFYLLRMQGVGRRGGPLPANFDALVSDAIQTGDVARLSKSLEKSGMDSETVSLIIQVAQLAASTAALLLSK